MAKKNAKGVLNVVGENTSSGGMFANGDFKGDTAMTFNLPGKVPVAEYIYKKSTKYYFN